MEGRRRNRVRSMPEEETREDMIWGFWRCWRTFSSDKSFCQFGADDLNGEGRPDIGSAGQQFSF
jgi:hypothetical protein